MSQFSRVHAAFLADQTWMNPEVDGDSTEIWVSTPTVPFGATDSGGVIVRACSGSSFDPSRLS